MLVVRKTWQEYRESTEYRTYGGRLGGYTVTPDTPPKARKYSAAGSRPNVARYLAGNPNCMKKTVRRHELQAFCYLMAGNNAGGEETARMIRDDLKKKIENGYNPSASRIFLTSAEGGNTGVLILSLRGAGYKELANLDPERLCGVMSRWILKAQGLRSAGYCHGKDFQEAARIAGYKGAEYAD
jgi:hypothetical protein